MTAVSVVWLLAVLQIVLVFDVWKYFCVLPHRQSHNRVARALCCNTTQASLDCGVKPPRFVTFYGVRSYNALPQDRFRAVDLIAADVGD